MVGTILRAFVAIAVIVAFAGLVGIFIMAGVASTHDVVPIPVPSTSYLASYQNDYMDAYRAPLVYNTYRNIDRVAENAYHFGAREIYRDEDEVVFEGYRGGIRFFISYMLERKTNPNTLTVVSMARVHGRRSVYLWKLVRPIHKRLAPYLLDRMAQAAPD
ncbi:MAG: hypothetical protein OEX18_11580 [Candidatus Krumholzibacteria bacterium]|nr:hypothetical protein [Candidatus Krumholzibacteria bacterium]MDH4337902.1 hypothetical protein [Candidatus Krumholzibacteria bacterium]MDH5270213.1 hypothetical protein [Candidatus Krumholzibacteria bacterium]